MSTIQYNAAGARDKFELTRVSVQLQRDVCPFALSLSKGLSSVDTRCGSTEPVQSLPHLPTAYMYVRSP